MRQTSFFRTALVVVMCHGLLASRECDKHLFSELRWSLSCATACWQAVDNGTVSFPLSWSSVIKAGQPVDEQHRKTCVRFNERGHAHALTFSCDGGEPLLQSRAACDLLIVALAAARRRHRFDIWAYVIMPEHVHLLVWPKEQSYSISRILLGIKRPVSYHARQQGLCGGEHFWLPGGGFDRNISSAKAVHAEIDYMHSNPVRRGLCVEPAQWRYSSAGFWAGLAEVPLVMDRTVPPKEQ